MAQSFVKKSWRLLADWEHLGENVLGENSTTSSEIQDCVQFQTALSQVIGEVLHFPGFRDGYWWGGEWIVYWLPWSKVKPIEFNLVTLIQKCPCQILVGLGPNFFLSGWVKRKSKEPCLVYYPVLLITSKFQQKNPFIVLLDLFMVVQVLGRELQQAGHFQSPPLPTSLSSMTREYVGRPLELNFAFSRKLCNDESQMFKVSITSQSLIWRHYFAVNVRWLWTKRLFLVRFGFRG